MWAFNVYVVYNQVDYHNFVFDLIKKNIQKHESIYDSRIPHYEYESDMKAAEI